MQLAILTKFSAALGRALLGASRDLAPIITVIALFQVLVLHQPFPELLSILAGLGLVIIGLALFVVGLDIGLFPLGETLAEEFARKGSLFWLLLFAFALGAGTTVAEPALIAVTREGAKAAAEAGLIENTSASIDRYALGVRLTVALSVGAAIVLGVLRILRGWSLLVTALGVGLARTIRGRDPLTDGFGLIALASLTPIIFVMLFGLIVN